MSTWSGVRFQTPLLLLVHVIFPSYNYKQNSKSYANTLVSLFQPYRVGQPAGSNYGPSTAKIRLRNAIRWRYRVEQQKKEAIEISRGYQVDSRKW